jgi:1-acyl-sn-glycerol-3-phosphate acyltransferase
MLHGLQQYPCIVAKKEVENIPFIGPISIAAQNLHLDRSSKDDKSGILK